MAENTPDTSVDPLLEPTRRPAPEAISPGPWVIDGPTIKDELGQVVCTWQIPGRDPQPWHRKDADFIVRARIALDPPRVRELLALWSDHYNATTPVQQADALLGFSNAIYHFGVDLTDDISWMEQDDTTAPAIVHVDLRGEDEDGVLRVAVPAATFDPTRVHPGATVDAGTARWHEPRRVRSLELRTTDTGDVIDVVLERTADTPDLSNDF